MAGVLEKELLGLELSWPGRRAHAMWSPDFPSCEDMGDLGSCLVLVLGWDLVQFDDLLG